MLNWHQTGVVAPFVARTLIAVAAAVLPLGLTACASPGQAQVPPAIQPVQTPTYADLATLAEAGTIVARVEVRGQAQVSAERAPGLAPSDARLYLETRTEALLAGPSAIGESLAFLADVPLTSQGKVPKFKRQRMIVFANRVAGRPAELQLAAKAAMLPASPELEERVRAILREFAAPDARPKITAIREAISIPGNLAGESETQLFLQTSTGDPVSLSVIRRPGMNAEWGVSWTEIVDQAAGAPRPGTLEWYRLACALPRDLPARVFLQTSAASQAQARADYALIMRDLGPCERVVT